MWTVYDAGDCKEVCQLERNIVSFPKCKIQFFKIDFNFEWHKKYFFKPCPRLDDITYFNKRCIIYFLFMKCCQNILLITDFGKPKDNYAIFNRVTFVNLKHGTK